MILSSDQVSDDTNRPKGKFVELPVLMFLNVEPNMEYR